MRRNTSAGTPAELLAAVKVCVEELGIDPNAVNDQGDAALHVAHSGDIARYLAEHGAARGHEEQARPDAAGHRASCGKIAATGSCGPTSWWR